MYWCITLILRFFKSLKDQKAASTSVAPSASASGEIPSAKSEYLKSLAANQRKSEPPRQVEATCESVAEFKHSLALSHPAPASGSGHTARRRPNYDNRKRRFWAKVPAERKSFLALFCFSR